MPQHGIAGRDCRRAKRRRRVDLRGDSQCAAVELRLRGCRASRGTRRALVRRRVPAWARHRSGRRYTRVRQHDRQSLAQRRPGRSLATASALPAADLLCALCGLEPGLSGDSSLKREKCPSPQRWRAYVADSKLDAIPHDVRDEAKRAIVNYLGCALGGSIEPALDVAIKTLAPSRASATAVRARPHRTVRCAARRAHERHRLARSRVRRHAAEELHPSERRRSPPRCSRTRARTPFSGRDFVHAFILGFEAESRIGNAVYPGALRCRLAHHLDRRACSARQRRSASCCGSRPQQMVWAFGLAATQAAGHPRDVRVDGEVVSARAAPRKTAIPPRCSARADFTAGERALEGPRGFAAVHGGAIRPRQGHGRLGNGLRSARNAYKPYRVRPRRASDDRRLQPAASRVSSDAASRSPPCACASRRSCSICATRATSRGRSRASTRFTTPPRSASCAARADLQEFTDEAVHDPALKHVRERDDGRRRPAITEDQAHIEVDARTATSSRASSSSRSATFTGR